MDYLCAAFRIKHFVILKYNYRFHRAVFSQLGIVQDSIIGMLSEIPLNGKNINNYERL